jgi:hypothetical protein
MTSLALGASRAAVIVAAAALLGACHELTAPAPAPDVLLSGAWAFAPVTPGGGGIYLNLRAAGGHITGTGREYRLCCLYDSFAVAGQYSATSRSFALAIKYSKGPTATYVGQAWAADSLDGVWTGGEPASAVRLVFYRQLVPACADSAPLLGTPDPAAPGYIVRFRDSVDAQAEASRLAARYGFVIRFVYQAAIKGFSADLSPATVTALRCEPSVAYIEYDGVVTAT